MSLPVAALFRRLAIEAGREIMKIYESDDFGVETKVDESPVTKADLAADKVIYAGLRAALPNMQIVTEEMASSHGGDRARQFILVDPLDGTKEFVKRGGDFTVNIALIEDGAPTRGVVFAPAKGRLFMTTDEGGAVEEVGDFDLDNAGPTSKMAVSSPDVAALKVVASASHRDQATEDYIGKYNVAEFKPAGSSLKFCLLANGEADLYPRLGRTMEWDTAAGHAVLKAAGGQVDVFGQKGQPLTYGKPGDDNPFFIAYAPGVVIV